MAVSTLTIYDGALAGIMDGSLPGFSNASLSAHLLNASYAPDKTLHQTVEDVAAFEVVSSGYSAAALTGVRTVVQPGRVSLQTDPVLFGDPVSVPPFRYLLFAYGHPNAPAGEKALLGYSDLSAEGGALEVVRGSLVFTPDETGWITLSQL